MDRSHRLILTLCPPGIAALVFAAGCVTSPAAAEVNTEPPEAEEAAPAPPADMETRAPGEPKDNRAWWPKQVDLTPLRAPAAANPYGDDFDYAAAFEKLDLKAVKKDIEATLTDSKDWWPADYGNYGPFFIRMAWHSAGTYRVWDGRGGSDGGQLRFEPLNSWPDNANLDKARRLLQPVKKKYGSSLSWADLMILTGNVAMENMGFETLGFAGGREDDWTADLVYWGPEAEMLASDRFHGEGRELQEPLAATRMGLIYVNPQGPGGNNDPQSAAHDIRRTFGLMAMNDEETVALIAGGHTFGKAHGAHNPTDCVEVEPAGADIAAQGTGWHNKCGTGKGVDTTTSGLEGAWTAAPVSWTHQYMANLHNFDWEKTQSPGGATQWKPTDPAMANLVPDAHDPSKRHAPMMLTTDLSLREDSSYAVISKRFQEDPKAFEDAFAKAWFKLTHRDLGPRTRYLGSEVPEEVFAWQDPVPSVDHKLIGTKDAAALKSKILASGVTGPELVRVAWAAASSFRNSDRRGGINGSRIRLAPQNGWDVNNPTEVTKVVEALEGVQKGFNKGSKQVSLADLLVLGGAAAIEEAAEKAGHALEVPFVPGRTDATAESTDVESFGYLEPRADGFRNYYTDRALRRPSDALVDKASLLGLNPAEMTSLLGGLRVLGGNAGGSTEGLFTDREGTLSNDFFVNLLDLETTWAPTGDYTFAGTDASGTQKWTATEVDLIFGSNAELRSLAEAYAHDEALFLAHFVSAWTKVMQADRFDLHR